MASLGVVSFILNSSIFTIFIYYRRRLLKSNDYKLLCSMIVADMFVGIFCTLYGALLFSKEEALIYKVSAIIPMFSTMFASISSIAGITVNRMIAVHRPLRYYSIMTPRRLMMSFIFIWIVPIVVYIVQLVIYKTCTSRFELKVRSVLTVGFFLVGSIALGVSNCLLYIAIRRQIRLINAHTMLTMKLQQLHYNSKEEEHESESQCRQTNNKQSSKDRTNNYTSISDNIGFDSGNTNRSNEIIETNDMDSKQAASVSKQDSSTRDAVCFNEGKDNTVSRFPFPIKTNKTKERELVYPSSSNLEAVYSLSQRVVDAKRLKSSADIPERSDNCGAPTMEVCTLTNHSLALVRPDSEQERQKTDEIRTKRLPDNPTGKLRLDCNASAMDNKTVRLTKNMTKVVGRLQMDRKKRNKARRENLHMAHMCILVVLAFITCWLPLSIYRLRYVLGMEPIVWFRRFALFLAAGNSLVNPFIYLLKQRKLRKCIKMAVFARQPGHKSNG